MNVRCWHLRIGEQTPPTRKHTMSLPVSSVRTLICPVTSFMPEMPTDVWLWDFMVIELVQVNTEDWAGTQIFLVGHHADKMVSTFVELVDKSSIRVRLWLQNDQTEDLNRVNYAQVVMASTIKDSHSKLLRPMFCRTCRP